MTRVRGSGLERRLSVFRGGVPDDASSSGPSVPRTWQRSEWCRPAVSDALCAERAGVLSQEAAVVPLTMPSVTDGVRHKPRW
jgi:hypothetical protein